MALGVFSSQKVRKKSLLLHIKKLPTCYLFPPHCCYRRFCVIRGLGTVLRTRFECQSFFRNYVSPGAVVVAIGFLQGLHEEDGVMPSLVVFAE